MSKSEGMRWFETLHSELGCSSNELKAKLIDFRERCRNSLLRASYPTANGIKKFSGTGTPSAKTIDFILSYLDEHHPDAKTEFQKLAVAKIAQNAKRHKLAITKILDIEKYRRSEYWKNKSDILRGQLFGWHYIFRKRLNGRHVSEIMYLFPNAKLTQVVDAYWYRHTNVRPEFYIGNFYCAESSLMGTFIQKSTDKLLHPVQVTAGYESDSNDNIKLTTGFMTGASLEGESIFHYPFAFTGYGPADKVYVDDQKFMGKAAEKLTSDLIEDQKQKFGDMDFPQSVSKRNFFSTR